MKIVLQNLLTTDVGQLLFFFRERPYTYKLNGNIT